MTLEDHYNSFTEKVACVQAVCEQFDIDKIGFESEDEKIAYAIDLVDEYEKVAIVSGVAGYMAGRKSDKPVRNGALTGSAIGAGLGAGAGALLGGKKAIIPHAISGGIGGLLTGGIGGAIASGKNNKEKLKALEEKINKK